MKANEEITANTAANGLTNNQNKPWVVTQAEKDKRLEEIVQHLIVVEYKITGWPIVLFSCGYEGCSNSEEKPFTAKARHTMIFDKDGNKRHIPALWATLDEHGEFKIICQHHSVKLFKEQGILSCPLARVFETLERHYAEANNPIKQRAQTVLNTTVKCAICGMEHRLREGKVLSSKTMFLLQCCGKNSAIRELVKQMDIVFNATKMTVRLDIGKFEIIPDVCSQCAKDEFERLAMKLLGATYLRQGDEIYDILVDPEKVITAILRKMDKNRQDHQPRRDHRS